MVVGSLHSDLVVEHELNLLLRLQPQYVQISIVFILLRCELFDALVIIWMTVLLFPRNDPHLFFQMRLVLLLDL